MSRQQERHRWYAMRYRCENPQSPGYATYGARGIKVCERWHDFDVYYADIMEQLGPCPEGMSIDRINNARGYEPGNVRWATVWQQAINSRHPGRRDDSARGSYIAPIAAHIYVQIANHLRTAIERDELTGRVWPADIGREAGVAMGTVFRALRILKDEGLVYSVPGRGMFVRKDGSQ